MTSADTGEPLARVVLVGLPLDQLVRAQQHHEELKREFALIEHPQAHVDHHLPGRLLRLTAQLQERFAAFTSRSQQQVADALAQGLPSIDLEFLVPPEAGPAAAEFAGLLDDADEFCRGGELLTLATPGELVTFRRWYLQEFNRQIDGAAPIPWSAVTVG